MTFDEERDWFVTTAKVFGHELVRLKAATVERAMPPVPRGSPTWRGTCVNCDWEFSSRTRRETGFQACDGTDPKPAYELLRELVEKRKADGSI